MGALIPLRLAAASPGKGPPGARVAGVLPSGSQHVPITRFHTPKEMPDAPDERSAAALLPQTGSGALPIPGTPATVGRGPRNEVVFDDDSVSDVHARLEYRDGQWWITDLGSTNGTRVNGERLGADGEERPLEDGALVQFGGVRTTFEASADVEPASAAPPAVGADAEERRPLRIPVWLVILLLLLIAFVTIVLLNRPAAAVEIVVYVESLALQAPSPRS